MSSQQPIIKKVIKKGGHGHHGGAWKVAYADFVTAMMAFFLLLWLLSSTTEEQKAGIADYFNANTQHSTSILGGTSALTDETAPGVSVLMDPDSSEKLAKMQEEDRFELIKHNLEQAIRSDQKLKELLSNLVIDITPEGLRIQIVDKEGKPMFASGSTRMTSEMESLLYLTTQAIRQVPNDIKISGHTDSVPYTNPLGYSNWDLSADRANATRRKMEGYGFPASHFSFVAGYADKYHLDKKNPNSATNRRISIILLRQNPV